jgi:manganese transport protein
VLIFFVTIMGLSFILSLFIVMPDPNMIVSGFVPRIPDIPGGKMLVAAFVGTTMAAATFLSRPLFIKGKGWTIDDLNKQSRDAIYAALLIFFISAAVMTIAASTLYGEGKTITKVFDMIYTLEPILGKFAVTIFLIGTLGAGLSSVFPILMITPILIADYQSGQLDIKSKQFRIIAGVACLVALAVPILGANPINAQILSQVFNVFVLPLVIISILILLNRKSLMGEHSASSLLNVGMGMALIFACVISYTGVMAIIESIN